MAPASQPPPSARPAPDEYTRQAARRCPALSTFRETATLAVNAHAQSRPRRRPRETATLRAISKSGASTRRTALTCSRSRRRSGSIARQSASISRPTPSGAGTVLGAAEQPWPRIRSTSTPGGLKASAARLRSTRDSGARLYRIGASGHDLGARAADRTAPCYASEVPEDEHRVFGAYAPPGSASFDTATGLATDSQPGGARHIRDGGAGAMSGRTLRSRVSGVSHARITGWCVRNAPATSTTG